MAQDFVGSNNIPLLVPSGQFGTRIMGGKDHSSPRYIFTKLQSYATKFFHETDSCLLKQLEDDGMKIEPEWYAPPIPLVLVNGTDGIGTGWSTKIPCHNPTDVIACVRAAIRAGDEVDTVELPELKPWYRGFTGTVLEKESSSGTFETFGALEYGTKKNTLVITELPVGTWTEDYKEWLEQQATDSKKTGIRSVKNDSTESTVCFTVTLQPDAVRCKLIQHWKKHDMNAMMSDLKLVTSLSYRNMHLFDITGAIQKFQHPHDIIRMFVKVRQRLYVRRRKRILKELKARLDSLTEKMRFLRLVIEGTIELRNAPKKKLEESLKAHSFATPYDPYLSMPLWSITQEKIEALQKECEVAHKEHTRVLSQSPNDLWEDDLEAIKSLL